MRDDPPQSARSGAGTGPDASQEAPRTPTRTRFIEPEMLVGLGALLVSVCALAVGIYEASLERHHARAEVWPHLEVNISVSTTSGITLDIVNAGIGPAVIKSLPIRDGLQLIQCVRVVRHITASPDGSY